MHLQAYNYALGMKRFFMKNLNPGASLTDDTFEDDGDRKVMKSGFLMVLLDCNARRKAIHKLSEEGKVSAQTAYTTCTLSWIKRGLVFNMLEVNLSKVENRPAPCAG